MRALAAGNRHNRIMIEQKSVTLDVHGGEVETWALYAHEWAQVSYGTGRERRDAAQERASVPATFRVLANPFTRMIDPSGYRIQFDQYLWDIVGSVPLGRDGVEITAVSSFEVMVFSLAGAISATSGASGTFSITTPLVGGILVGGVATGTISVSVSLAGTASGSSSLAGAISAYAVMAGAVSSSSALSGALAVYAPLAGAVAGASMLTGAMIVNVFPDPNLEDVTDATNGWTISGDAEPTGGTGPGITFFGDPVADLAGSNAAAFDAAVANSSTKTVRITVANWSAGSINILMKGGGPVEFEPLGNGDVSHNVTAGTGTGFEIEPGSVSPFFDITAISVT